MRGRSGIQLCLATLPVLFLACGRPGPEELAHAAGLRQWHAARDAFFRGSESPLTPEQRSKFRALEYFPPDASWQFEASLDRPALQDTVEFLTSKNTVEKYVRFGRFRFARGGRDFVLTLYASTDAEPSLFLPFTDATSGRETYGAGRYIDPEHLPDGGFRLDFNRAYNPYCAYNSNWVCPLAPVENHLDIQVKAGEKSFAHEP